MSSLIPTGGSQPPFSARLPPTLLAVGASAVATGALGTWIRATTARDSTAIPREVDSLIGYTRSGGTLLAVIAVAALLSTFAWLTDRRIARYAAIAIAFVVLMGAFSTISLIVDEARSFATSIADTTGVFHAGFGWGGWCLLAGAVALTLGILAAVLAEVDARPKGIWDAI